MEVLCKIFVLFALLFSATTSEPIQSSLSNELFDAIVGDLQLPQIGILSDLDQCTANFQVRNVEILMNAGNKLRQCANLDQTQLQSYLQQPSSDGVRAAFQQQLAGCSTRKCYTDSVMNLFVGVRPMLKQFWLTERCVMYEISRTLHALERSFGVLEYCIGSAFAPSWNSST
ncbi:PREDICTED: uncharacterized protein LOC108614884, partial [Drosophila arizonae]|uniref:Uncharacterized protein LOC108614884 n=1 Tax=Drosophila arizonae TaxID=7263 RepID=A0ABM1PBK7_DROAR